MYNYSIVNNHNDGCSASTSLNKTIRTSNVRNVVPATRAEERKKFFPSKKKEVNKELANPLFVLNANAKEFIPKAPEKQQEDIETLLYGGSIVSFDEKMLDALEQERAEKESQKHLTILSNLIKNTIPLYDPTMNLNDFVRRLRFHFTDLKPEYFEDKGYPDFVAKNIISAFYNKEFKAIKRYTAPKTHIYETHQNRNNVRGTFNRNAPIGSLVTIWKVPSVNHLCDFRKPYPFDHKKFKIWCEATSFHLRKTFKFKTMYVTGNDSCKFLYYSGGSALPPGKANEYLLKANLYVGNYHTIDPKPVSNLRVEDFTQEEKNLYCDGTKLTKGNYGMFANLFVKDKPIWRLLDNYFALNESTDLYKLQHAIDEVVQKHKLLTRPIELDNKPEMQCWKGRLFDFKGSFNLNHTVDINHSFAGLEELAKAFGTDELDDNPAVRAILNLVTTLVGLYYASNWQTIAVQLVSFCNNSNYLRKFLYTRIRDLLNFDYTKLVRLPFMQDDEVDPMESSGLFDFSIVAIVGSLLSALKDGIADILGPCLWDLVMNVKNQVKVIGVKSIAEKIIDYSLRIIENIKLCFESRSFEPLFSFRKYDLPYFVKTANNLVNYQELLTASDAGNPEIAKQIETLRKTGEVKPHITACSTTTYMYWLDDAITEGEELISFYQKARLTLSTAQSAVEKLKQTKAQLLTRGAVGSERVVPFAVMFLGPPGVGKTFFCQDFIKTVAFRKGYDPSPSGVYSYLPSSANFDDGCTNSCWCGVMDDKDLSVSPPNASTPSYCEKVIGILNSAPCQVEQANVNRKGNVFINFTLFTFCTNIGMNNVKRFLSEPEAFGRRFHYQLKFSVKPEYLLPGAKTRLDPSRFHAENDMFNIEIYKFADKDFTILVTQEPATYKEAMLFLCQEYDKHLSLQLQNLRKRTSVYTRCGVCGLSCCRGCGGTTVMSFQSSPLVQFAGLYCLYFAYYFGIATFLAACFHQGTKDKKRKEMHSMYRNLLLVMSTNRYEEYKFYFDDKVRGPYTIGDVDIGNGYTQWKCTYEWGPDEERHEQQAFLWDREQYNLAKGFGGIVCYPLIKESADIRKWQNDAFERLKDPRIAVAAALTLTGGLILLRFARQKVVMQSRENNTSNNLVSATWARPAVNYAAALPPSIFTAVTWSKEQLIEIIQKNMFSITCDRENSQVKSFGVAYDATHLIVTTHSFHLGDKISLLCNGSLLTKIITEELLIPFPGVTHLSLLYINTLQGCNGIRKFIQSVDDISLATLDEVKIIFPNEVRPSTGNSFCTLGGIKTLSLTTAITVAGDCGAVYVGRHGTSWRIYAIHFCVANQKSMGEMITQLSLDSLVKTNSIMLQQYEVYTQIFDAKKTPELTNLDPLKSQVSAVTQFNPDASMKIYGYLKGAVGSTMKTKCHRSIFWEDLRELERDWCGKENYWNVPCFKGFMVDEVFTSPFTNAFQTWNTKQLDHDLMCVAFCDYIKDIQNLDFQGYGILSEEQIFAGVPGSINSLNFKTSAGPPWNRSKANYMYRDAEHIYVDPLIWELYDKLEETLKQDRIPVTMANCVLKDEPTKPGKFPRVFCCLCVALNMLMKKYNSCWKLLMRNNPGYFESFVGIDLTSTGGNLVIKQLQRVLGSEGEGKFFYDGDVSAMDKSFSADLYDWAAKLVYILTKNVGGCPSISRNLILSLKNTLYNIKGDIIGAYWNPSGNDCTVELNGLVMSLCIRYAYYKMYPFKGNIKECVDFVANLDNNRFHSIEGFTFRREVSIITYGDDNLIATRIPWDGDLYLKVWEQEIGMIMKPADKQSREFKPKFLSEIDFCQRKFVFDKELNAYKGMLGKSRIARTLLIQKPSTLTSIDHAASVLSDTQREMFYYGRKEFEHYQETIVKPLANKYNLLTNAYFKLGSYDQWLALYREGKFRSWNDSYDIILPVIEAENLEQQSKMSNINLTNSSNAEETSATNQFTSGSVAVQHEVGKIMTTSNLVKDVVGDFKNTTAQKLPDNSIADFLSRPVEIYSNQLSTLDPFATIMQTFQPWNLFLNNTSVIEKCKNFRYINGTLQLTVVTTCTGGAYGLYTLTALPNGGYTNSINQNLIVENCLQTDHCVMLDLAGSPNAVLQLPFVYMYDYAVISDVEFRNSWSVSLVCLQPLLNSIPGGIARAYVKIYAHLLPGYSLIVPTYQGKETKISTTFRTLSSMADKVSGVPLIGDYAKVVGKAASTASTALEYFGFSRVNAQTPVINIANKSVTNVANVDVDDNNDVAGLFPDNAISIDPSLSGGGDKDILSFPEFFKHWTIAEAFPWDSGDISGEVLGRIPITPMLYNYTSADTSIKYSFGPAGFVGLNFEFWRGSMEYKIVIPVSKFHRGSIQIAWSPAGIANPFNSLTNITLNEIYDVSTDIDKIVQVGYARNEPFLRCNLASTDVQPFNFAHINGEIVFKVVNPLVAQDTTQTYIYVFQRAHSDMTFAKLRDYVNTRVLKTGNVASWPIRTSCFLQGGALGDEEQTEETLELVPIPPPIPYKDLYFGEEVNSLRALMQKPSQLARIEFDNNSNPTTRKVIKTYNPLRVLYDDGIRTTLDLSTYLSSAFVGVAASERYKIFPSHNCAIGACRMETLIDRATNLDAPGTLAPMTFCGPNLGGEFSIPYYTPRKFVSVNRSSNTGLDFNRIFGFVTQFAAEEECFTTVYHSFGSDLRVTQFTQIPVICFDTGPGTNQGQFYWT